MAFSLFVFAIFFLLSFDKGYANMTPQHACKMEPPYSSCVCHLANGFGWIDLRHLSQKTFTTPMKSKTGFFTYYLKLCGTLEIDEFQGCRKTASLCETKTGPVPYSHNIGEAASTRFEWRSYQRPGSKLHLPPRIALVLDSKQQSKA